MRLFCSIGFDTDVIAGLLQAQQLLRACGGNGNFSSPENLHLTLAFLGEVEPCRVPAIQAAMAAAAGAPFSLIFDRLGAFPQQDEALWYIAPQPSPPLAALQRRLSRQLTVAGFALEQRAFKPHLTLARRVRPAGLLPPAPAPVTARVTNMELMLSHRPGGRLTYTLLFRQNFK